MSHQKIDAFKYCKQGQTVYKTATVDLENRVERKVFLRKEATIYAKNVQQKNIRKCNKLEL